MGKHIYKYIYCLGLIIACFIIMGCAAPSTPRSIEGDFNDGKSIVIMPIIKGDYIYSKTLWSKDASLESTENYFLNGLDTYSWINFLIIPMDAGTYSIRELSIKVPSYDRKIKLARIKKTKDINSTIGNITVEKTPEQSEGGRTNNLYSYYVLNYLFNSNYAIGSITIKPNEVVLIPAMWIDIKIAQDACTPIDTKEDSFGIKFLNSHAKNPFVAVLDAFGTNNGVNAWSWSCPIEAFLLNIQKVFLEDLIFYIEAYGISSFKKDSNPKFNIYDAFYSTSRFRGLIFSKELLHKIVVRDFEIGSALKNAEKTEETTNDITTIQYKIEKLE